MDPPSQYSLTYHTYCCISKLAILSFSLSRKIKNVRLAHLRVTTQETGFTYFPPFARHVFSQLLWPKNKGL